MAINTVRIKATSREGDSRLKGQRAQGRILGKGGQQKQGRLGRNGGTSRGSEDCNAMGMSLEGLSTN